MSGSLGFDPGDAAVAARLRDLAAAATPAVLPPPDLARTVLRRRRRRTQRIAGTVAGATVSAAAALAVAAAYQPGHSPWFAVTQPSAAMSPTIHTGQRVIFDKKRAPERGDVVRVHINHDGESFDTILRVVALPGDRIACPPGASGRCTAVTVNGVPFPQPYAVGSLPSWAAQVVPNGDLFLLGDNRLQANDSRELGPVAISAVSGVATGLPGIPSRPGPSHGAGIDPPGPVPPGSASNPNRKGT